MPILRDQALTAGIMVATTGVLFKNALSGITGRNILNMAPRTEVGLPSNLLTSRSMPPDA